MNSSTKLDNFFFHSILNLLFLTLFSIFINKAPNNLFASLLLIFFIIFGAFNFSYIKESFNQFKTFFLLLGLLFLTLIISSLIHADIADIGFSLKNHRWIIYAFIGLLCGNSFYLKYKSIPIPKYFCKSTFISLTLLILIMSIDALYVVYSSRPYLSTFLSDTQIIYGSRVSWNTNPIFYAQSVFFLSLFFILFTIKSRGLIRYTSIFITFLTFLIIILTKSRSTWLAILCILPFSFYFFPKIRKLILVFGLVLLSSLFFLKSNSYVKRFTSITHTKNVSNLYRIETWKGNLKIAADNPLFGIGFRQSRTEKFKDYFVPIENMPHGHPHSEYLEMLASFGIFTFILFICILIYPLFYFFRNKKPTEECSLAFIFLIFIYITSFFDLISTFNWALIIFSWVFILIFSTRLPLNSQHSHLETN